MRIFYFVPDNDHGVTKQEAESFVQSLASEDFPSVIVRSQDFAVSGDEVNGNTYIDRQTLVALGKFIFDR